MITRSASGGGGWQLVLADLSLILFLVTLSALANKEARQDGLADQSSNDPEIAPSQALFRPDPLGPSLAEWLARSPRDDRATLTVFAQYSGENRALLWQQAEALASTAKGEGYRVRVVITEGPETDLHASLAYDAPGTQR